MNFKEYRTHDAIALAGLIRDNEVTPGELVEAAIEGLEAWNGRLNAVLESWVKDAREARPVRHFRACRFFSKIWSNGRAAG